MADFDFTVTEITANNNGSSTLPRDFALDESGDGDLLVVNGDLVMLTGAEAIASDLKSRLLTFGPGVPLDGPPVAGEWFLDTSIGLDFWGTVLGKNSNLGAIATEYTNKALETPGVAQVLDMTVSRKPNREIAVAFRVRLDSGAVLEAVGRSIKD